MMMEDPYYCRDNHLDELARRDSPKQFSALSPVFLKTVNTPSPHIPYLEYLAETEHIFIDTTDITSTNSNELANQFNLAQDWGTMSDLSDDDWRGPPTYTHEEMEQLIDSHDWLPQVQTHKASPPSIDK